jgi:hypothetical protein
MYNNVQGTELDLEFIWAHMTRLNVMLRIVGYR